MSKRSLIQPRPVRPALVQPSMIDAGVLYFLDAGEYYLVSKVEPYRVIRYTDEYTPYPVTLGYWVTHEKESTFTAAIGEADTPLYIEQMPKVGMGATLIYPDDRYPYTVIVVNNQDEVVVQEDRVLHVSGNFQAGNVVWDREPDPQGDVYTLRYKVGVGWMCGELYFQIGTRDYYLSPEI